MDAVNQSFQSVIHAFSTHHVSTHAINEERSSSSSDSKNILRTELLSSTAAGHTPFLPLPQSFNDDHAGSTINEYKVDYMHCFAVKSCPLSYILCRAVSAGLGLECASIMEVQCMCSALLCSALSCPDTLLLSLFYLLLLVLRSSCYSPFTTPFESAIPLSTSRFTPLFFLFSHYLALSLSLLFLFRPLPFYSSFLLLPRLPFFSSAYSSTTCDCNHLYSAYLTCTYSLCCNTCTVLIGEARTEVWMSAP